MSIPVEVLISKVAIKLNGRTNQETGNDYLTVTFVHPNAAEDEKSGKKKLALKDDTPVDMQQSAYDDQLLFKANLQGRVPVVVVLTDVWNETVLEKFVKKVILKVFDTAVGTIAAAPGVVLADIVKSAMTDGDTAGYVHVIGIATTVIDPGEVAKKGSLTLNLPLTVPIEVKIDAFQANAEIIPVGNNGSLELTINMLV